MLTRTVFDMAYTPIYYSEVRSSMRDRLAWRLEIEDSEAASGVSSPQLLRLSKDLFNIEWGQRDDNEVASVRGSSLEFSILCVDDMKYVSLFPNNPLRFRVSVYRIDVSRRRLMWRGFLSADSYSEDFSRPPYWVSLTATDGFSLLNNIPYLDTSGNAYSGTATVYDIVKRCVDALGLELPVVDWTGIATDAGALSTLKGCAIDQSRLYLSSASISCGEVLQKCIESFGAQIFQSNGRIVIRRLDTLMSPERPSEITDEVWSHELWQSGCDIRNTASLEMNAPYREVKVSVNEDAGSSSRPEYYTGWGGGSFSLFRLGDRVAIMGTSSFRAELTLPQKIEAAAMTDIDISLTVGSITLQKEIKISFALRTVVDGRPYYWNSENMQWEDGAETFIETQNISPLGAWPGINVSTVLYTSLSKMNSVSFSETVSSMPSSTNGELLQITVILLASRGDSGECRYVVSDVSVSTEPSETASQALELTKRVSPVASSSLQVNVPFRDGGYLFNMANILDCPILDPTSKQPVASWLYRGERGSTMHIIAEGIMRLRGDVMRQLAGELRCHDMITLNTLFSDRRFSDSEYYTNYIKFHAARQVFDVQLRKMSDLSGLIASGRTAEILTLGVESEGFTALYDSLFVNMYESGAMTLYMLRTTELSKGLVKLMVGESRTEMRKGIDCVCFGDSRTARAYDNFGNVISQMDIPLIALVNISAERAVYDADRKVWVFWEQTTSSTTVISIVGEGPTVESQFSFRFLVKTLTLISGGFIIETTAGDVLWHMYELHSASVIPSVMASDDPQSSYAFQVEDISDSLMVVYETGRGRYLARRTGNRLLHRSLYSISRSWCRVNCGLAVQFDDVSVKGAADVLVVSGATVVKQNISDSPRGIRHAAVCGSTVWMAALSDGAQSAMKLFAYKIR